MFTRIDNQQKVTMVVLSVFLSFASCTMPSANFKSPPSEEGLKKAAVEERKQKARAFFHLCETSKAAPLNERNAIGPVWLVNVDTTFGNANDGTYFHPGWSEASPNSLSDGKNIVCIFPDYKNTRLVDICRYDLGFGIRVYSFTTHVTLVDLETNEKVGQTEFLTIPDCPKGYVYSPGKRDGDLRELRGGPATTEEVINWAKQRWSP